LTAYLPRYPDAPATSTFFIAAMNTPCLILYSIYIVWQIYII